LVGAGFGGCLVVAHAPGARVELDGTWTSPITPGAGAQLTQQR
jgi:hypothetical protein